MRIVCVLMVGALFFSCAKPMPPAQTPARASSPVQVTWEPMQLTETSVRLRAHVRRLAPFPGALSVRIEVPNQATMRVGRTYFELPVNDGADDVVEPVELTFTQLPVQDLLLKVEGLGKGMGVSFSVPYRFGRPEPTGPMPAPSGPDVKVGGKNLGPSIPLAQ